MEWSTRTVEVRMRTSQWDRLERLRTMAAQPARRLGIALSQGIDMLAQADEGLAGIAPEIARIIAEVEAEVMTEAQWRDWVRGQIARALAAARVTDQGRVREHRRTTLPGGRGDLVALYIALTVPDPDMAEASLVVWIGRPDADGGFAPAPPLVVTLRLWEDTLAPSVRDMGWI